jgi:GT2 family glycosyltransferase
VSVIVPTHQRPAQLLRCLAALAAQDYPRDDFEIIVVEDGDYAGTKSAVAGMAADRQLSIEFVAQSPRAGPASARNAGVAVARGTYVAFTDDDCEPAADWLSRLVSHLSANPSCAVGGLVVNLLSDVPYSTASQLLIDYLYEYYRVETTGARFFTSNNLALSVDDFRTIGGFDHSFPLAAAEDREFCERWQRLGRRLVFAEDAVVRHAHRLTFRAFLRQHFNYGRGADFLHRSRARHDGAASRPKLEPLSFYVNLICYPCRRRPIAQGLPLTGLMGLSQAAYAAGYLRERMARARRGD